MKKVFATLNLNSLADNMFKAINDNWKNPFESPVVIVPDTKVEQWLKFYWMRNNRDSVLMNLKFVRLENFLFDNLKTNKTDIKEISLSEDFLRDILVSKLISKVDDKYYFETFNETKVNNYLFENQNERKINETRLFDFASKMAALFLTYEKTRCNDFPEWQNNWQKKLYDTVIGQEIIFDNKKYLTLGQRLEICKKENNGKICFSCLPGIPVYMFGFSTVCQQYLELIDELSKICDINIYLQTALEENELTLNLGKLGSINTKLFTGDAELEKLDTKKNLEQNSLLKKMQNAVLGNAEFPDFSKEKDNSISVTSAPSKVREMEVLHSKICSLLKDGKASLSEILVVGPNVQDYQVAVTQIFDQILEEDDNKYARFPKVPYTITDYSSESSLITEAIKVIYDILLKGYFSRSDLFTLVHNAVVKQVKNISDEMIESWITWAENLNITRDRKNCTGNPVEDWQKAKIRLLLSRLTENKVVLGENSYQPYSDIGTSDNGSLYKFIDVIDSLKKIESYSFVNTSEYTENEIEEIYAILNGFLNLTGDIPEELKSESLVYKEVIFAISQQKKVMKICGSETVSSKAFILSLLNAVSTVSITAGSIFANGITFTNFKPNRILSSKYIFMIGMDSKNFPGVDKNDVLDLRTIDIDKGDDTVPGKNKNAFLCQFMAAEEGLYISYVGKNLQKDEEFFRSSVVNDLFNSFKIDLKKSELKEERISIDEKRPWSELFTPRSFRNKGNFSNLMENNSTVDSRKLDGENRIMSAPERIILSQFYNFLREPFQFYANNYLAYEDDSFEKENIELEPLKYDNIQNAKFVKELLNVAITENKWEIQKNKIHQKDFEDFYTNSIQSNLKIFKKLIDNLKSKNDLELLQTKFKEIKNNVLSAFINKLDEISTTNTIENRLNELEKVVFSNPDDDFDYFATKINKNFEDLKNSISTKYYDLFFKLDKNLFINDARLYLRDENALIDDYFGDTAIEELYKKINSLKGKIYKNFMDDIVFLPAFKTDFLVSANIKNDECNFSLNGVIPYYFDNDSEILIINIKSDKYCISPYVMALAYIAQKEEENKTYNVTMYTCSAKSELNKAFLSEINPKKARECLIKIYEAMYEQTKIPSAVPISMLYEYEMEDYEDFSEKFFGKNQNVCTEWQFYQKRDLFTMKDIGYTFDNYVKEWEISKNRMTTLLIHKPDIEVNDEMEEENE